MTNKELIRRVIEYNDPPRIGYDFNPPHEKDLRWVPTIQLRNAKYEPYLTWGTYPELKRLVPDFNGEVKYSVMGNLYGRLKKDGNGECIKGALEDDWSLLDSFEMPTIDMDFNASIRAMNLQDCQDFVMGSMPVGVFSTLRDLRVMDNALADTILEQDNVRRVLSMVQDIMVQIVRLGKDNGLDAVIIYDDWGMQHSTFVSPDIFRLLFKPVYQRVAAECHDRNMKLLVHSCGLVTGFIEDFIDAGVDVMQFDQPEIYGSANLARNYGGRMAFHCPVDIQKVMATGNREYIEKTAYEMVTAFKTICGGGLIAKDYPSWQDINVEQEWADWARKVIVQNSAL